MRKCSCFVLALLLLLSFSACKKETASGPLHVYEEEGSMPAAIVSENGHWYAITNTYGLADFAFAAGDSYDTMEPIYHTPNGGMIRTLAAEGDYCAFYERAVQNLRYVLYNAKDGSLTDMYVSPELSNQNGAIVLLNGCAYFGLIDYQNSAGMLMRYDIASGKLEEFCPLPYAEIDTVQALSHDGDDILVTVKADLRSQIFRISTIDGTKETIDLPPVAHTVYSASYDPTQDAYIIYYQDGEDQSEDIGIYHAGEDAITSVYTFNSGCYAYYDIVECRDGKIYWSLQDNPVSSFEDVYDLVVYDCATDRLIRYPQGIAFALGEESVYYLTLCFDQAPSVELHEIPYK